MQNSQCVRWIERMKHQNWSTHAHTHTTTILQEASIIKPAAGFGQVYSSRCVTSFYLFRPSESGEGEGCCMPVRNALRPRTMFSCVPILVPVENKQRDYELFGVANHRLGARDYWQKTAHQFHERALRIFQSVISANQHRSPYFDQCACCASWSRARFDSSLNIAVSTPLAEQRTGGKYYNACALKHDLIGAVAVLFLMRYRPTTIHYFLWSQSGGREETQNLGQSLHG